MKLMIKNGEEITGIKCINMLNQTCGAVEQDPDLVAFRNDKTCWE